jgi:formylglycine-generating enzyme required for sulfatase activity/flagellar hook assembly protein FlgD
MEKIRIIFTLLIISFVFVTCRKDEEHYLEGISSDNTPLQQVIYTVSLPDDVEINKIETYTISNAYGNYPLVLDNTLKKTMEFTDSLDNSALVKVVENGSCQLVYLLNDNGNAIMLDILKLSEAKEKTNTISVESTAIAMILTHSFLITANEEKHEILKSKIITLPSFKLYKEYIREQIIFSIKNNVTPDFTNTPHYKNVVADLLNSFLENFDLSVGRMECFLNSRKDGKILFTLINEHKRVLHFYTKKVYLNNAGLPIKYEDYTVSDKEYPELGEFLDLDILYPTGFNLFESFFTTVITGGVSPFKSESRQIERDLGEANQLQVDVYGLGRLNKPFKELSEEDKNKFLLAAMHGAFSDFLMPIIDLTLGVKNLETSNTTPQKFNFNFGARKYPIQGLLIALSKEFLSDVTNISALSSLLKEKDYTAALYYITEFMTDEIVGDLQAEPEKRRYLNYIYNYYKKATGITKTSRQFREQFKKAMNEISAVKNANFVGKVINISELTANIAGGIQAYFETPYKQSFIFNKTSDKELDLLHPIPNQLVKDTAINFDWSFERGNLIGPIYYNLLINEYLDNGTIKKHKIENILFSEFEFQTNLFQESSYNFDWQIEVRKLNSNNLVLISDKQSFKFGQDLSTSNLELINPLNGDLDVNNNDMSEFIWSLVEWNDDQINDPITYEFYFGETNPPSLHQLVASGNTSPTEPISTTPNTTYFWKIVAKNGSVVLKESPIWSFTTKNGVGNGNYLGETVFVQGGTAGMGCQTTQGCAVSEVPYHSVTLDDFIIGKYEVTNSDFITFLNSQGNQIENGIPWLDLTGEELHIYKSNGIFYVENEKGNYPVNYVSWYGAKAYSLWIGGDLPTEAQWEFAARGGSLSTNSLQRFSGGDICGDVGWYNFNSGDSTHEVGQLLSNELGLYDMSGNVAEYCNDWMDNTYYSTSPSNNPSGPTSGNYKIIRGGGVGDPGSPGCEVFNRGHNVPTTRSKYVGFRVVF